MEDEYASSDGRRATPSRPRIWTSEETERLVQVWSMHETLYNSRHPDYYKRDKRAVAMNQICMEIGDISMVDITRKMENLRSYFGREKRKLYDSKADMSGEVKSRWAYFEPLMFLDEHMNQKRPISKSGLSHDSQEDVNETLADSLNNFNDIDDIYHVENQHSPIQNKKSKSTEKGSLDATIARLQKPKDNSAKLGLRHVARYNPHEGNSLLSPRSQASNLPFPEKNVNDLSDDMIFAEHVGRTIMSISDDLLKEDLKLQIQQCLCSTKRKQIGLQQEQQRRILQQNNSSFVSYTAIESPTSPVNTLGVQIVADDSQSKTQ